MTTKDNLLERIDFLISSAYTMLDNIEYDEYRNAIVNYADFKSFRASSLSFILQLFGKKHPYYLEFKKEVNDYYISEVNVGISIINNIKTEIENGWLNSIKGIISAEIFSDFLEMAEHLLKNDYKDASAVMIGSVLEEHLRQLCFKNGMDTNIEKNGKIIPLRADRLNNELTKLEIYNKLDQKNITAQLDLRNKAAHGKYNEYEKNQVSLMYQYVLDFLTRNPI